MLTQPTHNRVEQVERGTRAWDSGLRITAGQGAAFPATKRNRDFLQGYLNIDTVCYDSTLKYFLKILFIFRDRVREGEKRGEKHHWERCQLVASRKPPTGDLAHNPRMCPDQELNLRAFGSQTSTRSTEPHQPGQVL